VSSTIIVLAAPTGRLLFPVDLGPAHTAEQVDFGAGPPAGWVTSSVTISPVGAS
jgi:hypothetical protein